MVYKVWLMGGLGNQLFQVNYGYRLMEMGLSVQFVDNLCKKSFLTERILSWKIHPYMLDGVVKVATHTESNIAPVFFSKINMLNQWSNYIDCQPIPNLPKNIFGYFQCKELQDQVFFNNNIQPLLLGLSKSRAKIVAHLRFGDAPNLEQNMKYYVRALNELGRSRFCVCTDDKKFAQKCKKKSISFVQLLSPTTSKERMKKIIKDSHDMIYYISMLSTTGGKLKVSPRTILKNYAKIKKIDKSKNLVIGFGITSKNISSFKKADGCVVGSEICKKISQSVKKRQNPVTNVNIMVKKLKNKII